MQRKSGRLWLRDLDSSHDFDDDSLEVSGTFEDLRLGFTFDVAGGLTRLCVEFLDDVPAGGLTRRRVAGLELGRLAMMARKGGVAAQEHMLLGLERSGIHASPALRRQLNRSLRGFAEEPRPGRRGRPDVEYAALAATYVDLVVTRGRPVSELAARAHVSVATLRNLLTAARTRGMLTKAPKGRRGGELTPKARQLLEEGED